MAGRVDFLGPEERKSLLTELEQQCGSKRQSSTRRRPGTSSEAKQGEPHHHPSSTGCLVCRLDSDHPNLLLCEGCNGEYHTYCLTPPLQSVPNDDWFCGKSAQEGCVSQENLHGNCY